MRFSDLHTWLELLWICVIRKGHELLLQICICFVCANILIPCICYVTVAEASAMCLCIAPSKILVIQVQIAACDTFRSGAVEQLRTHCNRLNIPLYERGYEKDPAKVAYEAIKSAERSNIDVLLVDTAGEIL